MTDLVTAPITQTLQNLDGTTNPNQNPPAAFNGVQGNRYDSGVARVPAPQVPMRPADQPQDTDEAPDIHPVDAMASAFIDHLISKDKGPAAPPAEKQPSTGSFADKLAGAVSALGTGLGDARSGGDPRQGHGWLSSVGATLNARNERLTREKQQEFDNQERLKNDQINVAMANVNLRQHALAVQQQEKSIRDNAAASSAHFVDTLRDNYKVQDNISQTKLNEMLAKDPSFLQTHTGRITGYEPVYGADGKPKMEADGKPVESPVWSLVDLSQSDLANNTYTVPATVSKKWADAGLKNIPAGTVMPVSAANHLDVQAERYGTSLGLLNLGKVQPLPDKVKDQMAGALQDPEVQHALAQNPGSPLAGLYSAQENVGQHLSQADAALDAAQKSGNPQAIQAAQEQIKQLKAIQQNVDATINNGFTDQERSAYQKQVEADRKQTEVEQQNSKRDEETARHNRAEEAIKLLESQGGSPEILGNIGEKLANAEMVPDQLSKRSKNYNAAWDAADKSSWSNYGKPYDGAQAQLEYAYTKAPSTQNMIKLINSVTDKGGSLDIAMDAAKGLPGLDEQTANKVFSAVKSEFGNSKISDFHTSMLGLADEYSKIMGGGIGSDKARDQALNILQEGYSKGQLAGAEQILRKDIAARQRGLIGKNRFLQKEFYGTNGMTVTMVAPDGKTVSEVPKSLANAAVQKGARVANKQDYNNLQIPVTDH